MDGVPTLKRYLISKVVSSCCEGYTRIKYNEDEYGWTTPKRKENGDIQRFCQECGEKCDTKELIWMTHKQISKGCYRPLPEPVLITDFIFDNLDNL